MVRCHETSQCAPTVTEVTPKAEHHRYQGMCAVRSSVWDNGRAIVAIPTPKRPKNSAICAKGVKKVLARRRWISKGRFERSTWGLHYVRFEQVIGLSSMQIRRRKRNEVAQVKNGLQADERVALVNGCGSHRFQL